MNNCNYIINKVLESEDHVILSPSEKDSFCFKLAFLIKEEIRRHKWIEGEKHNHLEWDEAKKQWMDLYYKDFTKFIKSSLKPVKTKQKKSISDRLVTYNRRSAMISGGSV